MCLIAGYITIMNRYAGRIADYAPPIMAYLALGYGYARRIKAVYANILIMAYVALGYGYARRMIAVHAIIIMAYLASGYGYARRIPADYAMIIIAYCRILYYYSLIALYNT